MAVKEKNRSASCPVLFLYDVVENSADDDDREGNQKDPLGCLLWKLTFGADGIAEEGDGVGNLMGISHGCGISAWSTNRM